MFPKRPRHPTRVLAAALGVGWVAIHFWIFSAFFPNEHGKLGVDYGYFLPYMLDGEFWRSNNGFFAIPWFTPGFCGGIPRFANPQALYFAGPQLFTFLSDPITGLRLTLGIFGGLGYAGFYLFQRRLFGISRPLAVLGAALFLFNSLFSSRLVVGHLTFHSFMLVPWLSLWLLERGGSSPARRSTEIAGIAVVLAYLASHALPHVLLQAILFTGVAALLQGALVPERAVPWRATVRTLGAVPLSLALSGAKLYAMASLLESFPRTLYPLPGVPSVAQLLRVTFQAIFLEPTHALGMGSMVNAAFQLERPEFEFGVGPLPLFLIALAVVSSGARWVRPGLRALAGWRGGCLGFALLLLSVPLSLNFHAPAWHDFLKSLPILGSSFTMLRWFSIYIPTVILAGSLAAQSSERLAALGWWILAAGGAFLLSLQMNVDRSYYHRQGYDPRGVVEAFAAVRTGSMEPSIHSLADPPAAPTGGNPRNSTIARGESQLDCYETLFGFRLEKFPRGRLHAGPVMELRDGAFNLNDPACYLFPETNACVPGEPFREARREDAEAFASYRPFPFEMPTGQRIANALSGLALVSVALILAGNGLVAFRRWIR